MLLQHFTLVFPLFFFFVCLFNFYFILISVVFPGLFASRGVSGSWQGLGEPVDLERDVRDGWWWVNLTMVMALDDFYFGDRARETPHPVPSPSSAPRVGRAGALPFVGTAGPISVLGMLALPGSRLQPPVLAQPPCCCPRDGEEAW